ncbi:microtubule-associated protein RP/EB family member 1C-like protein [Tanacetum coccineum]
MATNIGMMDSAYFVGRSEILSWINSTLHLNLSKVEEHIEVSKLVKGRPLDNLEFIQWMKRYCDSVSGAGHHNSAFHITELKLTMDSLEKERDFYFAKLRDIEILCQSPTISNLPIIDAIKRILYAAEEDPSIVEEAQAMLLNQEKQLNPISEDVEEYTTQKRKSFINLMLMWLQGYIVSKQRCRMIV